MKKFPFALYGLTLLGVGLIIYLIGLGLGFIRNIFFPGHALFTLVNRAIVLYSGFPIIFGFSSILLDVLFFRPLHRHNAHVPYSPIRNRQCTVVLTAYNDEESIGQAVKDFKSHPLVKRVIVISNNSTDDTMSEAQKAGAIVFNEPVQGYGPCVYRALSEGLKYKDTELTVLCEGDMTFRAYDLDKFLAYIPHCDIVVGTRTVESLQANRTQLTSFMHYGNTFVGKMLEFKHIGKVTLSDVGTTYKMCRNKALRTVLHSLDKYHINLEFNAYFIDKCLEYGLSIVECPITFHKRIGQSKGGNVNNMVAVKLGLKMMKGILIGWSKEKKRRDK